MVAGIELGTLDTSAIQTQQPQEVHEALLFHGRMPDKGGYYESPAGLTTITAVAVEIVPGILRIMPSLKRLVTNSGVITGDSLVIKESEDGQIKPLAVNFNVRDNPYLAHQFGIPRYAVYEDGRVTWSLDPFETPELEIGEIKNNGIVIAKEPLKQF